MESLRNDLKKVQKEIQKHPEVEQSDAGRELIEQISPALEEPGELSFRHHRQIAGAIKNAMERFEYTHPRLIDGIRTVINSLNEAGV
ncbi:MAG: DUF4404 family protein [Fibrobacterota bacterium]